MPFEIRPLSSVMGARVAGLDLSQPIPHTAENALKAAFLQYHLLCFESCPLSVEKFLVFARVFGTPQLQLLSNLQDNNFPEVSILNSTYKTRHDKPKDLARLRLSGWPPMIRILKNQQRQHSFKLYMYQIKEDKRDL